MIIKGKSVVIRAIEEEDLDLLKNLMNNPKIEEMTVGDHLPVSLYSQKKWLASSSPNDFRFIVESYKDGAVGMINIVNFDSRHQSCGIGIKTDESLIHHPGVGIDAMLTMMNYAFMYLNVHTIRNYTLEYNKASLAMQKFCGYTVEGREREACYKKGKFWDVIITGITKSEFEQIAKERGYFDIVENNHGSNRHY